MKMNVKKLAKFLTIKKFNKKNEIMIAVNDKIVDNYNVEN